MPCNTTKSKSGRSSCLRLVKLIFDEFDVLQAGIFGEHTGIGNVGGIIVYADVAAGFIVRGEDVERDSLAATEFAIGQASRCFRGNVERRPDSLRCTGEHQALRPEEGEKA